MGEEKKRKVELLKVSINAERNITSLIKEEFLDEFKEEFDEIRAINLVLSVSKKDSPDNLIVLGHSSPSDSDNNKIFIDTTARGISSTSEELMKKVLDIL